MSMNLTLTAYGTNKFTSSAPLLQTPTTVTYRILKTADRSFDAALVEYFEWVGSLRELKSPRSFDAVWAQEHEEVINDFITSARSDCLRLQFGRE